MVLSRRSAEDNFYRTLLTLVLPITLQGLISHTVNAADVFMLGYVGQDALSAVSLANQVEFWIIGFFWGATSGTALMIAQYWGKGDGDAVQSVMGIGLKVSLVFTALLALASLLFPEAIMTLFTGEEKLVRIGAGYLRITAVTFVLQAVSQIYECSMRSIGRAAVATVMSSAALLANVVLNAALIFGLLGLPRLGVTGVAVATVIARLLEAVLCVIDALKSRVIRYDWRTLLGRNAALTRDFFRYSIPALANDISWTLAFSSYSVILGHLGSDVVAAAAVATTVRDFCSVACMSLGAAAVTIIGNQLGAGNLEGARRDGNRILWLSLVIGTATGLVILALRPLLVRVFPLTDSARDYLRFMLLVSSYYLVGQTVNTVVITGVFRAGGDTKFGMWCDTINMWCVSVPIGFLSAFVLHLPPKWVYFILCLDEFYKVPVEVVHYRKYKWLRNVTREEPFGPAEAEPD